MKACKEGRVTEKEVDDFTELLMRKLIQLDEIEVVGDLRLHRREQVISPFSPFDKFSHFVGPFMVYLFLLFYFQNYY